MHLWLEDMRDENEFEQVVSSVHEVVAADGAGLTQVELAAEKNQDHSQKHEHVTSTTGEA